MLGWSVLCFLGWGYKKFKEKKVISLLKDVILLEKLVSAKKSIKNLYLAPFFKLHQ